MDRSRPARLRLNPGEKRLNPRYPRSTLWDEKRRREHRRQRDRILADAGLEPAADADDTQAD